MTARYSDADGAMVADLPAPGGGVFSGAASDQTVIDYLANGGKIEAFARPVDAPAALSPFQFWTAMGLLGLGQGDIEAVLDKAIKDHVDNAVAKARLRTAQGFHRDDPFLTLLWPAIKTGEKQIDAAWTAARDFN